MKPVLQALILADAVYQDVKTGKRIIAGTFDCLYATEFPSNYSHVTNAYVCLTEVRGTIPVKLYYVDLELNEVLMEVGPIEVSADDPLESVDFTIEVPPIPMPHEGVFGLELHAAGMLLASLRIQVARQAEKQEQEEQQ